MNGKKSKFQLILLLGLSIFCLLACQTSQSFSPIEEAKSEKTNEYVIGPEDVLKIHVWKHENISVTVPVRSDGKITVPLINDIEAAGFTPDQLKDKIAKSLENYIELPTVSVIVEAINSRKISVSGNVNTPGIFKIGREVSLIEAISLAEGLSDFANPRRIRVIRKEGGKEKIFEINYFDILNGEDLKQNIDLYPGDSVIVP